MQQPLALAVILFGLVVPALAAVPSATSVETALHDHLAPHPRLLLNDADAKILMKSVDEDPRMSQLQKRLFTVADLALQLPPLEHQLHGRRMLGVSRDAVSRIPTLALAYRLSGKEKYLNGARENMLNVAAFKDWNPKHFLDVAEMTTAVAIGYDWLFDHLTPQQRATIRQAIVDKGIKPSYTPKPLWWVRGTNNWTQVCHGGLTLGALAIAEDEPALATKTIERALENLPRVMRDYAPDGAYPEGPTYWGYGTTYNCLLIGALQSALGSDFGLSEQPGFLKTADYRLHVVGPTGLNFSYSDSFEGAALIPSAAAFFLAHRRGDPSLLFNEVKSLDASFAHPPKKVAEGEARFGWLLMIWAGQNQPVTKPAATHYVAAGKTPVAMFRSSWDPDATFIAIKGGSPGTNHAHMDVGSFCLDAEGVRWASDPGAENYNKLEQSGVDLWNMRQDSQRWQIYRLGPFSHNILTVNGENQIVRGNAKISRSGEGFAILDTSAVYAGQLAKAARGVMLRKDKSVRLQDEITAPPSVPATVRWAMLTHAAVKIDGTIATLTDKGKTLHLLVVSPKGTVFKIVSTDPPHDYDGRNPNSRLITFEVTLPAGKSEVLAVDFTPDATLSHGEVPSVVPMKAW